MARSKGREFSPELRDKLLLWCDRHCCLCKKQCDVLIELHHIVSKASRGGNDEDNAMPLCFDCHARVGHYDTTQPRGRKYQPVELKRRRDQVYDEFTRHLVPNLQYRIKPGEPFYDPGFEVIHLGQAPPIKLRIRLEVFVNGSRYQRRGTDPLYLGEVPWSLNPGTGFSGHILLVNEEDAPAPATSLRIGVYVTVIDIYERDHELLPVTYVFNPVGPVWWLDPVDPAMIPERIKRHETPSAYETLPEGYVRARVTQTISARQGSASRATDASSYASGTLSVKPWDEK